MLEVQKDWVREYLFNVKQNMNNNNNNNNVYIIRCEKFLVIRQWKN